MEREIWLQFGTALGIGLLVGIERERRKGEGPRRRAAGIRTFAVSALVGAVSQYLGGPPVLAAAALGVAAIEAVAYWRRQEQDPGLTTEVALLLTLLLGGLAMREPGVAAGLGVTLTALLLARERIHHFARSVLTERELHDGLVLAAAALVILPLMPDRHLGPFQALNPRLLWMFVLLVMTTGAIGHAAQRLLGPRLGLPVSGLAGGFVSSVATIASMGRLAQAEPRWMTSAVAGAALSSLSTVVQMALVLAITSPATLAALAWPLAFAGVVAFVYGAAFTLRGLRAELPPQQESGRAFSLATALVLAATVSFILILVGAMQAWLGDRGLLVGTALAGFADSHSSAVSVASLVHADKLAAVDAVVPILAVLTTNAITKSIVAMMSNRRFAWQVVPGLVAMIAAAWGGWWMTRVS